MKIITGICQADSGEMTFQGKPLSPKSYRESLALSDNPRVIDFLNRPDFSMEVDTHIASA
jgi:hypothetical protein